MLGLVLAGVDSAIIQRSTLAVSLLKSSVVGFATSYGRNISTSQVSVIQLTSQKTAEACGASVLCLQHRNVYFTQFHVICS